MEHVWMPALAWEVEAEDHELKVLLIYLKWN